MTESASLMTSLPDSDSVEHADSVGYAVPVVDLAIDSPGDDPQVGELLARGPNMLAGYWQRRSNRKCLRRRVAAHRRRGARR